MEPRGELDRTSSFRIYRRTNLRFGHRHRTDTAVMLYCLEQRGRGYQTGGLTQSDKVIPSIGSTYTDTTPVTRYIYRYIKKSDGT